MRRSEIKWITINWRREIAQMAPYVSEKGGVIYITGTKYSACNTFVKLVRSQFADNCSSSISVQLNPEDAATRTPDDIITKLEQKLGIPSVSPTRLTFAKDVHAGENVIIKDVTINYEISPFEYSEERMRRTKEIIDQASKLIAQHKITIILHNLHEILDHTILWFWTNLWNEGLENLVDQGLLLLVVFEGDMFEYKEPAAAPDLQISLPDRYTKEGRATAAEDIAKLLEGVTHEGIQSTLIRADSLLTAWEEKPSRVLTGLINYRANLKRIC